MRRGKAVATVGLVMASRPFGSSRSMERVYRAAGDI